MQRNSEALFITWLIYPYLRLHLIECLHMGLVLLSARPFSEALAVVKETVFPMILANSVGVAINVLFISELPEQRKTRVVLSFSSSPATSIEPE